MKKIKLLLVGILLPILSYATVLVDSDFEDGTFSNWVPKMSNECWEVDSSTALEGAKNLKAIDLYIDSYIYVSTNVVFDLTNYDYEWKFMMDSLDPTSGNKYWFWLAANSSDFNDSNIKGYLVGVQYDSSNDNLSIWKVNGISDVTNIVESTFDVGSAAFSVKVTRSSGGVWSLFYKEDTSFVSMTPGGTATDTSITNGLTTTGPYFISTSSNSGNFRFDACTISRETPSIPVPIITSSAGTNVSAYVNEEVTFDITATVGTTSYGGLFSTNKTSGSTFTDKNGYFSLVSTFAWTPNTIGSYTVIFTSTNETGTTTLPVHIEVTEITKYNLWINELHYENASTDANEGVEICGKAGINLANYTVYAYDGNAGGYYYSEDLSGIIPDEDNSCYGAVWFPIAPLQGGPDGLALVKKASQEVLYFISYGGSFKATAGPADGMDSVDIGVSEPSTSPTNSSLQLKKSGSYYEDFDWTAPSLYSHDLINDGQTVKLKGAILIVQ